MTKCIADQIREGLEFPPGTDEYDHAVELMALRSAKWRQKNEEDKGADGFGDGHWEALSDDAYHSRERLLP